MSKIFGTDTTQDPEAAGLWGTIGNSLSKARKANATMFGNTLYGAAFGGAADLVGKLGTNYQKQAIGSTEGAGNALGNEKFLEGVGKFQREGMSNSAGQVGAEAALGAQQALGGPLQSAEDYSRYAQAKNAASQMRSQGIAQSNTAMQNAGRAVANTQDTIARTAAKSGGGVAGAIAAGKAMTGQMNDTMAQQQAQAQQSAQQAQAQAGQMNMQAGQDLTSARQNHFNTRVQPYLTKGPDVSNLGNIVASKGSEIGAQEGSFMLPGLSSVLLNQSAMNQAQGTDSAVTDTFFTDKKNEEQDAENEERATYLFNKHRLLKVQALANASPNSGYGVFANSNGLPPLPSGITPSGWIANAGSPITGQGGLFSPGWLNPNQQLPSNIMKRHKIP